LRLTRVNNSDVRKTLNSEKFTNYLRPQEDGRIFIDLPDSDDNPCTACGVCCSHFRVSFYAGEMDTQPGGFVPADLVSQVNPVMACMKGTEAGNGRCIAYVGEIGANGRCSIYTNRPSPCREYPVFMPDGSMNPDCLRLRTKYGVNS
jgi:hypothetical protein